MKALLIPVKSFRRSKQRLAGHYSEDVRAELAEAMCRDFFTVLQRVQTAECIYVVSAEPVALDMARANGWIAIPEIEQQSESASVDAASRICAAQGVTALLRMPIDLPLVGAEDIEGLLAAAEPAPSALIVPSREGTGTNALLRSPPGLFPSHFGPGSFALHLDEAERAGARIKILRNPRIAIDIDDIDDLHAVARDVPNGNNLARWLSGRGLSPPGG